MRTHLNLVTGQDRLENRTDMPETARGSSGYVNQNDENILASIDKQKYMNDERTFVQNFFTYNSNTLRNGDYKRSWTGLVAYNPSEASELLQKHINDQWNYNCSTYPEFYSKASDVIVHEPYISHTTHDNSLAVGARLKVECTQDEPQSYEWDVCNVYLYDVAVYFDANGKIYDVRLQTQKKCSR